MAEILGVIGGVAASSEIVKSLVALKRLCSSVREAAQRLRFVLEEVQNITGILQAVEMLQNLLYPFVRYRPEWEDCQKSCKTVACELSEIVKDLRRRIEGGRTLGSIRYALKEDKIKALQARLERAKSNIMLAQQILVGALQRQQLLQTLDMHLMISDVQHELRTTSIERSSQNFVHTGSPEQSMPAERIAKPRTPWSDSSATRKILLTTLRWVTNFGLQLRGRVSQGNWTFNFRTYYMVPADARISRLCAIGDIEGIKNMMTKNNALMSARIEPWGMTPLHAAISHGQVETARWLIRQGADLDDCTLEPCHSYADRPWSCFRIFSYYCDGEFQNPIWRANRPEMLYLLAQENVCYDLSGEDATRSVDQWLEWTACVPGEEDINIMKRSVFPPYHAIPLRQRLRWACTSAQVQATKFWNVLGQDTFDTACVALALKDRSCDPLPRVIDGLGEAIRIMRMKHGVQLLWRLSSEVNEWILDLSRIIHGDGFKLLLHGCTLPNGETQDYLRRLLSSLYSWSGCSISTLPVGLDLAAKQFAQDLVEAGLSPRQLEKLGRNFRHECVGKTISWKFHHRWRNRFWPAFLLVKTSLLLLRLVVLSRRGWRFIRRYRGCYWSDRGGGGRCRGRYWSNRGGGGRCR